jgi:uncharacterized protein (DUF983 family)
MKRVYVNDGQHSTRMSTGGMTMRVLGRALRLKCPSCGETKLFESFLKVRRGCDKCGMVFQQEQGYFIGAIYINVGLTYFLILGTYAVSLIFSSTISTRAYFIMLAFAAVVPIAFFRWSRSLWLAVNFLVVKPERR